MPTSLIHIVLSTRGCSPWRPAAVMSTAKLEKRKIAHSNFQGTMVTHQTDQRAVRYACGLTLSPVNPIPGSFKFNAVKKKRELFLGVPQSFLSSYASPPRARGLVQEGWPDSLSIGGATLRVLLPVRPGPTAFADLLGPTNSRPNAVLAKPFSTSALKVLA